MKRLIFIIAISAIITSCTRVTPQEAGFKIENAGDYRGIDSLPLLTGYNTYMPGFSHIVTIPTTMQHVVWSEEGEKQGNEVIQQGQHIVINCLGGSGFKVDVGVNYRVNPYQASKIYLKYKTDDLAVITQTFLRNIVRGSMQDVSGYLTVDSILNGLPKFEMTVRNILTDRFAKEGFMLDNFNIISMPRPVDPNLAASINAKIKAKQDAETAIQQLSISIAEANKKIATARGDSAEAVINASGEAEAIRVKQREITPQYIEYIKAQQWDGKLPSTMLGSGSNTLFNLK